MNATCKNCARDLQPDYAFCPSCSQKADLHRLNFHEVTHEGIHYFTHADKGIFRLIRDLAVKGGTVGREFIEGKRKRHFPPVTFFFIVAAINLLAINLDGALEIMPREQIFPNISTITDPQAIQFMDGVYRRYLAFMGFIGSHVKITTLVTLPIISFIFYLFYRKKSHYNYVEHLFAGMYMYGFTVLFFTILAGLNYFIGVDANIIYWIVMLFQVTYFSFFYREMMHEQSTRRAIVASICALGTAFVFFGVSVMLYVLGLFGG